ncbi:MAG: DUF429 domain-containing protein [Gammaproteobacteria bacterium]|nr:DUF429 domain-containing protein [Gammaproteobacteria bacterium]MCY4358826.1 DUF429 domain-containing protein [Gammaproteobacteria bacterium]
MQEHEKEGDTQLTSLSKLLKKMRPPIYCGVDGCRAGWFFFISDGKKVESGVVSKLEILLNNVPSQTTIMVDIPIGIREGTAEPRDCDVIARKLLGSRASCVFTPPIREILYEKNHREASDKSSKLIGKGISVQAFGIMPKILEVDNLMSYPQDKSISKIVREIHPEICFYGLNGCLPVKSKKKVDAGFQERLEVLRMAYPKILPNVRCSVERVLRLALDRNLRRDVSKDDLLDAMVALLTAATPPEKLHTLPNTPKKDSRNLPMEIVYATL